MNPTTSSDALSQLQTSQSQALDPNAYLQQQNQAQGVNAAQQTATGLRGAIDSTTKLLSQVAPSVMGRTQNSLVTDAQANRQVANEQAPISANLTDQTNKYNEANQNLSKLESEAQQAANGQYQGQQDKLSYLQNVYNSLYQKEQDASNMAERQREYNNPQPSQAASNPGIDPSIIAALLGGGSTASSPVSTLFNGYNPSTDKNYTEQVVIPTLQSQYGYSAADAAKAAYQYRKQAFGE